MTTHSEPKKTWLFVLPWSFGTVGGGVNQVVINLAHQMIKENSYSPLVLMIDWSATSPIWGEYQGIRTVRWRIRGFRHDMSLKARIMYKAWICKFERKLIQFCTTHCVSIINFHYVGDSVVPISWCLSRHPNDIKILTSFHGSDITALKGESRNYINQFKKSLKDTLVVVCSKRLGERLNSVIDDDKNYNVIHNGVDEGKFNINLDKNKRNVKNILNIGTYDIKKGQKYLLGAFSKLLNNNDRLHLTFVGASGSELENLKKSCVDSSFNEKITFVVDLPHNEISQYLQAADIFVFPSVQEAFGIVLLEAGLFSLPVVASNVGGIPEIINSGENGLLVAPENSDDLAQAIQIIIDNPDLSNELGKNLRRRVEEEFTWKSAHDKYIQLVV